MFYFVEILRKDMEHIMEESVKYICDVCGYVYEGDINSESDDYVCPVCGAGKDVFELQ